MIVAVPAAREQMPLPRTMRTLSQAGRLNQTLKASDLAA